MASPKNTSYAEFLLPGERIIDCIKFGVSHRNGDFMLTDQRVLVSGHTGALGPSFTLVRGNMVSGFPLTEYESFTVGTGRRPVLFLVFLALLVAGGLMFTFPMARYGGLFVLAFSVFSLLAWTAWPQTFITVCGRGLKISGRVKLCEAIVFLERLQLAALAAKAGKPPREVRQAAALSGKTVEACRAELGEDAELGPDDAVFCREPEKEPAREADSS